MRAADEVRVDQERMVPAIAEPVASIEILCFANRLTVGAAHKLARRVRCNAWLGRIVSSVTLN